MEWVSVDAKCNCPGKIERWTAYTNKELEDNLTDAKDTIRANIREHVDGSERCRKIDVTLTVHYEETVPP